MLHPGLYEQVINQQLTSELQEIPEARKSVAPIDKAEASKVLAQYLADVVQKGMDNLLDNGGDIAAQVQLTNKIVELVQATTQENAFADMDVNERAEQLLALLRAEDPRLAVGKTAADLNRPETSIAQSSLFTGAIHEPQMYAELKKKIVSADRITGGAAAYTYLGTANYMQHQGSRPMNITWRLDQPIPAKFLKKTNKLVVG